MDVDSKHGTVDESKPAGKGFIDGSRRRASAMPDLVARNKFPAQNSPWARQRLETSRDPIRVLRGGEPPAPRGEPHAAPCTSHATADLHPPSHPIHASPKPPQRT